MAGLQERGGSFRVIFRYEGKQRSVTLGKISCDEAESRIGAIDLLLLRIKQQLINVPPGVTIEEFLLSDGRVQTPLAAPERGQADGPVKFSFFKEGYLEARSGGSMEANSLATARMHLGHFEDTLGKDFDLRKLTLPDLQRHITARRKKLYRGQPLSPVTLTKEMASLRAAWNWGALCGLVKGAFPSKGLFYPKADELPPFMTWQEIERKLAIGGLSEDEQVDLWECLYLRKEETKELLEHVKQHATAPWLYPMLATGAYTGARRSELLRMEAADVNLEAMTILVREKKRSRKQRTTRYVSLVKPLADVLKEWLANHPGGKPLFCQAGIVAHTKKRSRTTGHKGDKTRATSLKARMATIRRRGDQAVSAVTKDEAHDHLKRTLADSKWKVLRGYHVLRHSFISCLAADGVDQRIIDDFVGHQTDEQRKRYRHLLPDVKQKAISGVFG